MRSYQEFTELSPVKRRGNRRYYQRHEVLMIRQIRPLLYEYGYTIGGAKAHLISDNAKEDVNKSKQLIHQMIAELEDILGLLK